MGNTARAHPGRPPYHAAGAAAPLASGLMPEFAHFTPTELPWTLVVLVAGFVLGVALGLRARRSGRER